MTKYIKGKDGKFAGSIGSGKTAPAPAPRIPAATPTSEVPTPPAQRHLDARVQQALASIEMLSAFHRTNPATDARDFTDAVALESVMMDHAQHCSDVVERAYHAGHIHQARAAEWIYQQLMTAIHTYDRDRALLTDRDHIARTHPGMSDTDRAQHCRTLCASTPDIANLRFRATAMTAHAVINDSLEACDSDADAAAVMSTLLPDYWS